MSRERLARYPAPRRPTFEPELPKPHTLNPAPAAPPRPTTSHQFTGPGHVRPATAENSHNSHGGSRAKMPGPPVSRRLGRAAPLAPASLWRLLSAGVSPVLARGNSAQVRAREGYKLHGNTKPAPGPSRHGARQVNNEMKAEYNARNDSTAAGKVRGVQMRWDNRARAGHRWD